MIGLIQQSVDFDGELEMRLMLYKRLQLHSQTYFDVVSEVDARHQRLLGHCRLVFALNHALVRNHDYARSLLTATVK